MMYNFFQFFDLNAAKIISQNDQCLDGDELHLQVNKNTKSTLNHTIYFLDQTIYLLIESGASLQILIHDFDQIEQKKTKLVYHILLEQDATCTMHVGLLFAADVEIEIHLYLHGHHAQANIFGVYGLSRQERLVIKTFQMHEGAHTNSSVTFKGMLKDQSQVNIEGLIHIRQHAIKTVAAQENKNIICDKRAQVKTVPSIEVLQHDVQCFHGAAVGQFDQKHVWSLQSKGLSYQQAYQLLIQSFFGEIAQKFKNSENFMEVVCKKMI